jgi:hypothetical protein
LIIDHVGITNCLKFKSMSLGRLQWQRPFQISQKSIKPFFSYLVIALQRIIGNGVMVEEHAPTS